MVSIRNPFKNDSQAEQVVPPPELDLDDLVSEDIANGIPLESGLIEEEIDASLVGALQNPANIEHVNDIVKSWGLNAPDKKMFLLAETYYKLRNARVGEIIVELGLAPEQKVMAGLKEHDGEENTTAFIDWFADKYNVPAVSSNINKILAIKNGVPIFDNLHEYASVHEILKEGDPQLLKRCDEIECVIVKIEDETTAVIFSSVDSLTKWQRMGRNTYTMCPVLKELRHSIGQEDFTPRDVLVGISTAENVAGTLSVIENSTSKDDKTDEDVKMLRHYDLKRDPRQGVKTLGKILDMAIQARCSDISIMLQEDGKGFVFVRQSGDLIRHDSFHTLSKEEMVDVSRYLQTKSGANPQMTRPTKPLDGAFSYKSPLNRAFIRCAFGRVKYEGVNEFSLSMSLRLLIQDSKDTSTRLADLKLSPLAIQCVQDAVHRKSGLILVVGPTNSGKSTTVEGCLGEHEAIWGTTRKRVSIENPVEQNIRFVDQNTIDELSLKSMTIEDLQRNILRQDPDLLFYGEVRDAETAIAALQGSITGHLVLTTGHAGSFIQAVSRFAHYVGESGKMDLIDALLLVLVQHLVPKLCPHCRIEKPRTLKIGQEFARFLRFEGLDKELNPKYGKDPKASKFRVLSDRELENMLPDVIAEVNPKGCDHEECRGGKIGSIPVNDVVPISRELKQALMQDKIDYAEMRPFMRESLMTKKLALLKKREIPYNSLIEQ